MTKFLIGEVESVDISEEFAHEKLSPVLAMYKAKTFDEAIAKAEGINYSDKEYKDLVAEEYQYNTEKYDSEAEYEKKNRESLKDNALSSAVQKWIAKHATFSK